MIDHFLFDFDGTVANTIPGIMITLDKTRFAMDCHYDLNYAKSLIGTPLVAMGAALCGDERAGEFTEVYRSEYKKWGADKISFYDGMRELLDFLVNAGMVCAVVTSKRKDSLLNSLEVLNAAAYFDLLVTKESTDFFKPHPAPVEYALTGLNAEASRAVMIGDTHYDLECGKAAGVKTIGVTWGVEPRESLQQVNPDFLADSAAELMEICKAMLSHPDKS